MSTMIVFTTERRDGVCVATLEGRLEAAEEPEVLVGHLFQAAGELPLVIDLSRLESIGSPRVAELLAMLEAAPRHATTAIVHRDVEVRRQLRALEHRIPVTPTMGHVINGSFTTALEVERARTESQLGAL